MFSPPKKPSGIQKVFQGREIWKVEGLGPSSSEQSARSWDTQEAQEHIHKAHMGTKCARWNFVVGLSDPRFQQFCTAVHPSPSWNDGRPMELVVRVIAILVTCSRICQCAFEHQNSLECFGIAQESLGLCQLECHCTAAGKHALASA